MGMNFPPSMYQLHLQYIHLPLLPFHYAMACQENHFHHGRFFPLEYLQKALALGEKAKMGITENTPIEDIVAKMNSLGVNYDQEHIALLRRCKRIQEQIKCWKEEDFKYVVVNGKTRSLCGLEADSSDPKAIQAEDCQALQNYGRPYTAEGKPTGTYYGHPKLASEVSAFS